MSASRRWLALRVFVCLVGVVCAVYALPRLQVGGDITHFLPPGSDPAVGRILRAYADSRSGRTLVLLVESRDPESSVAEARQLEAALARRPDVAFVRGGVDGRFEHDFHELFFPRRLSFVSTGSDVELERSLSEEGLREHARGLRAALSGPEAPLVRATAPADPLLSYVAHMRRARSLVAAELPRLGDRFLSLDGRAAVLFVELRGSAFDAARARSVLRFLDSHVAARRRVDASLRLYRAGVPFIASAAEKSIRTDVERVSSISMAGVIFLFLLMFRSPRYLAAAFVPLVFGTVVALAAGVAIFGRIHGLTLAFGSSLIGVAIDFVEHFVNHHVLEPDPDGPEGTLRRIWPGIFLAAATTIAGIFTLGFSSYPGIREIAVFGTIGILAALVATRVLVAPFLPTHTRPTRVHVALVAALANGYRWLAARRSVLFAVPAMGVAIAIAGLPRIRFIDDVASLHQVEPRVMEEDRRVMERVGAKNSGVFVSVTGTSDDDALERALEVERRLHDAKDAGALRAVRSVTTLVFPARLAERNLEAFRRRPELPAQMARALDQEGFRPEAFDAFREAYPELTRARPLTLRDFEGTSLEPLLAPFVLRDPQGTIVLSPLDGLARPEDVERSLEGVPSARLVDRSALLRTAYGSFRRSTLELSIVGILAVFLLCYARYRDLRWALAAFLPALLGGLVAFSVQGLAGIPINLLHVLGLMLVLGMGVDYGVFVIETREHPEEIPASLASTFVAMLTTVLSFGILGLSVHPALRAIGITAAVGVCLSMALSPISLLLASTGTEKPLPETR